MAAADPLCLCGIRGCPRSGLVRETRWRRVRRALRFRRETRKFKPSKHR